MLSGCTPPGRRAGAASRNGHGSRSTLPAPAATTPATPTTETAPPEIPAPHPGRASLVSAGPPVGEIALTVDDGSCGECVAGYVDFAERTGLSITFCPNGSWGTWDAHADRLRPLIEAGQVQVANHTWSHPDLRRATEARVRDEIERNEEWIQKTFRITARPWFRPPFGARNSRVDGVAGGLGYTKVLLWNATLGDATPIGADELLALADRYFRPGAVVLGHANHPTVLGLFDRLRELLDARALRPVTLDTMFATSRAGG